MFKSLLKLIPIKLVISLAWEILKPLLIQKACKPESKLCQDTINEIELIIKELTK